MFNSEANSWHVLSATSFFGDSQLPIIPFLRTQQRQITFLHLIR
jgi:hypothetical protein